MKKISLSFIFLFSSSLIFAEEHIDTINAQEIKLQIDDNTTNSEIKIKPKPTINSVFAVLTTGMSIGTLSGIITALYEKQFNNGEKDWDAWLLCFGLRITADKVAEKVFENLDTHCDYTVLEPTSWITSWISYILAKKYL